MGHKTRIIPVLFLRNGSLVQSRGFERYSAIGSPTVAAQRINSWCGDEIIYLDISGDGFFETELYRVELLRELARQVRLPLAYGGGIRTAEQAAIVLSQGADKVVLNTAIFECPTAVKEISALFGSQAVVASLDFRQGTDGSYRSYVGGTRPSGLGLEESVQLAERLGVGEILINSIDRDGSLRGFDLALVERAVALSPVPVIALGGAGTWHHFEEVLASTRVSAVAAGNCFHHSENSVFECKSYLYSRGQPVRKPPALQQESTLV